MTISPLGVDMDSMFFDSGLETFPDGNNLHDQLVIVIANSIQANGSTG